MYRGGVAAHYFFQKGGGVYRLGAGVPDWKITLGEIFSIWGILRGRVSP